MGERSDLISMEAFIHILQYLTLNLASSSRVPYGLCMSLLHHQAQDLSFIHFADNDGCEILGGLWQECNRHVCNACCQCFVHLAFYCSVY